ncbi:MAG: SgcJ/EcaC family oxidoreductase [Candidatus Marsarchaeota archaeon]|nr:SgcJ/EcaC family oxidoreductase [Candidatus Marsarchaeota archaeon]
MTKISAIMAILAVILVATASEGQQKPAPDEAAIRQAVQSYVEAFNRNDATAVAALWSDDGEYVAPSGDRFKGRKKIEEALKAFFADNKDVQLEASSSSIRFPSPNRAVETGTATVTRPGQTPEETQYIASYVKKGAAWKLTSVKEEESSAAYQHLKDLEWLIGEWIDRDENVTLDTVYKWARNNSFISGSFTVYVQGKADLQGTQVIGWDPVAKTIKSWVFDSQGGFVQGTWSRKDNQWIVHSSGFLSTGEKVSAINTYTHVDDNSFTFQSVGREIGGEPMPDIEAVTAVRVQPTASRTAK